MKPMSKSSSSSNCLMHYVFMPFLLSYSKDLLDIIDIGCLFDGYFLSCYVIYVIFNEILFIQLTLNHIFEGGHDGIELRPLSRSDFGENPYVIGKNLERSKSWEENNFTSFFVDVFLVINGFWDFEETLGQCPLIDFTVWYLILDKFGKLLKEVNIFDLVVARAPGMEMAVLAELDFNVKTHLG